MADYNVNMKQWNGSSFDNVLPLAFNSKALEGKSYDDIIQYAQNYTDSKTKLVLIDSVATTAVDQTIRITPATVGMSNLCALMIVSFTNSTGPSVSDTSYIQGKTAGKVLFETIADRGGLSIAITYLFSIYNGLYTGAYSTGVCYNRNSSTTTESKATPISEVQFNTIATMNLVFKGAAGSTATIYGLLK